MVDNPDLLPKANLVEEMLVPQDGYVAQISALDVGIAAFELGAGRAQKGDAVDLAVGVISYLKVGDAVKAGDIAFAIHANSQEQLAMAKTRLERAIVYRDHSQPELPLFYDTFTSAPPTV